MITVARSPFRVLLIATGLSGLLSCNPPTSAVDAATMDDGDSEPVLDLATSPDLSAPVGDSLPKLAVAFFQRKDCPRGWQPLAMAAGRTLVPTVGMDPIDIASGEPLMEGEDRAHGHAVMTNFNLSTVSYAGIAGEANHGLARGGSQALTGKTNAVPIGLPYVQLLVCNKLDEPDPRLRPVAKGTLVFFRTPDCPKGFVQAGGSQGRLIIGVPELATPGQKFGGLPLKSGEKRVHHHALSGSITTSSHGIALASGSGASGYAKNDKHPYQVDSIDEPSSFPYLQLLHCQKE